jgi:phospholipid transport system substrate-binding protein
MRLACRFFVFAIVLCLSMFSGIGAAIADTSNDKVLYIRNLTERILGIVDDKKLKKDSKDKIIVEVVSKEFDFEWNARMAIGLNWKKLNEKEQTRYLDLYSDIIKSKWIPKLYGKNSNVSVRDKGIKVSDTDDWVILEIIDENNKDIRVDIRVRNTKGPLKIINFVSEGVDLAMSYRTQFNSLVEKSGVDALFEELTEKAANI